MLGCFLAVVPVRANTLTKVLLVEFNYPKRRLREISWIWIGSNHLVNDFQNLIFT